MNDAAFADTQEVYRPIAVLQAEHEQAMKALCSAVAKADADETRRLFELIEHVERSQREAARLVRARILYRAGGGRAVGMNSA